MAWSKNVQGHSLTRTFHLYHHICIHNDVTSHSLEKKNMWWALNYRLSSCKSVWGLIFFYFSTIFKRFLVSVNEGISLPARVIYIYSLPIIISFLCIRDIYGLRLHYKKETKKMGTQFFTSLNDTHNTNPGFVLKPLNP